MALVDKNIIITPNKGQTADPKIAFTAASSGSSSTITLNVYTSTNGTLSFEGSAGQLFSISNSFTGTIFSVNDVSGIPSIEVLDTGQIKLAQYNGYVSILGTTNATSTASGVLQVSGGVGIGRDLYVGGTIYGTISASGVISTATNLAGGSAGQIPYQNSAGITQYIGTGTNGSLLQMGANTATFVTTANIYVANAVTATNIRGGQLGQIPYQNSAGITQYIGTGTAGSLLQMGGATTATFVTTGNIYVGYATQAVYSNTATNVAGGTTGAIIYQSGVGATTNLSIGTSGQILTVNVGATAPQWTSLGTITAGNATTATNLAGGLLGQIPYQNSAGITQYIGTGTTGSLLQMGANTATFVTTSSIYVGYANTAANAVTATSAAVAYSLANTSSLQVGYAAAASQINTLAQPASSTYYLTFVDTNSATATAKSVYTTGTFIINPSTGQVGVNTSFLTTSSKLVVNGRIESITDPAGEGGQVVLRGRAYRWSIDNYFDTFRLIREDDVSETNGATILTVTSGTNNIVVIGGTNGYSGEKFAVNGGAYINGILTATSIYGTFNGTIGTVSINTATNLAGGTAGAIHYQVSPGVSGFIGAGVTGSLLQMGASTATFVTTSSIYVGYANTAANAVTATSAAVAYSLANTSSLQVGFASAAAQVNTVAQGASANYFLTFVDSNNATATAKSVYTTSTVYVNPVSGILTAKQIAANSNTNGFNILIGDDAWIGDVDQANTFRVTGNQNNANGYIIFGNSNTLALGRTGSGPLTYGGDFSVSGTTAASSTTTGALQVIGGVGIGGNLYVGGTIFGLTSISGTVSTATNLAGGAAGQIPYQNSAGITQYIGTGTAGSLLQMGANTATFVTTGSIYVGYANTAANAVTATSAAVAYSLANAGSLTIGSATTATNLAGGTAGAIHYQVSPGVSGYIGTGTIGSLLQMGANTATFVTTGSIYVGYANTAANAVTATSAAVAYSLANAGSLTIGSATTATNLSGGLLGQIPYQTAAGITQYISTGTTGSILQMGANTATFVTTGSIYVGNAVTATNIRGGAGGSIPYQTAAGVTQFINIGSAGQVLQSDGSTASFVSVGTLSAGTATSVAGGLLGQILYQTAAGVTGFIGTGTAGTILQMGANTATFVTTSSIYVGNAVTATNLAGGTAGAIHYQISPGVSGFISTGTTGSLLQMGANTATFVTTGSIYVGYANTAANAVTATSAAVAYSLANTSTTYVGRAVVADNASTASQVTTVAQTSTASHYLTFVSANNATPTVQSFYTTSAFSILPGLGNIGINGTNPRYGFSNNITLTGGTTVGSFNASNTVQSDVTVTSYGVLVSMNTQATSFTLNGYRAFHAGVGTVGAGSTITNAYGFVADATLGTAATNAYGFLGTIASGTGKWNVYATGTAQNYFAGNVGIGTGKSVPSVALDVAGTVAATSATISGTTAASSTTTGALQVIGGVGIGGALYTGLDAYHNGVRVGRGVGANLYNTVVGNGALDTNSTGTDNVAVGYLSMNSNTTGRYNTAVGSQALDIQSTDYHNTAIGYNSLGSNNGGSNNVAVGSNAGATNSSGSNNSLLGYRAGFAITTGAYNVAFGADALTALTTQSFNSAFGYRALYSNTSGTANTGIGCYAGYGITTAQYSVGIGYQALEGNTTVTGDYNTAVGGQSIRLITSGTRNTGVGYQSLYQVTGQSYNTAVGAYSQVNNFGGSYNTSLGDNSLYAVSTGQYNIAIGYQAGNSITTGTNNTIIGSVSGTAGMTGTVIVAAGTVERFRIDSVGNMGIGTTTPSALLDVNGTVGVRSAANATSSSTGALQVTGGAGIGSDLWVGGTAYATVLQSTSDVNFKKDITTITNALNTVLQMRGVEYKWTHNSEPGLGLIAQEVQPLVPAAVSETGDRLTVGYGNLVGLLVEAIKEQQQQILALQQEIRDLKR
jgi:hypothetical protein